MTEHEGDNLPPPDASELTSEARDRSSAKRDTTSEDRDRTAAKRDRTSEARDRSAEERDRVAEVRDRAAGSLEAGTGAHRGTDERREHAFGRRATDVSAGSDRLSAASDRAESASDREAAHASRKEGAGDRIDAADDREAASTDRDASARERAGFSIDEVTGAYRRGSGLVEMEREMMRAKRTRQPFVIAFIDVDGLKTLNDSLGHDAGDRLLRRVVDATRAQLRSYDLIVRFGGDEFVCGLSNLGPGEAAERFRRINAALSADNSSISVGLADMQGDDSLVELIARADEALLEQRNRSGVTGRR